MLTPIILSGGNGTRLYPMSRKNKPKQFIELMNNMTMFSQTVDRVKDKKSFSNPIILGNIKHIDLIKQEISNNNLENTKIFLEPKAKNTSPAICSVVEYLYKHNRQDEIIFFLPSDAFIQDKLLFQKYMLEGEKQAENNKVVVFGIKPLYPETGYGYIKLGDNINNNSYLVDKFTEKPDLETAKNFVKSNEYLWNAGIFMSKVKVLYNLFKQYQPTLLNNIETTIINSKEENNIIFLNDEYFNRSEEISIDYAIIENLNANNLAVVSMNIVWSDLGSYKSLYDLDIEKDNKNNLLKGNSDNIILYETSNSYIKADKKIICCANVDNLVVVEEDDVILIMNKNKAQDVKKIVEIIKNKGLNEML